MEPKPTDKECTNMTTTEPQTADNSGEEKAEKPKVDWAATLTSAFLEAASSYDAATTALTEEAATKLGETARTVPAAARGNAQGLALKAVVENGYADALPAILDVINNLPKASTRVAKKPRVEVDPVELGGKQASAILVAWAKMTNGENGAAIAERAQKLYNEGIEDETVRNEVLGLADRAVKAVSRKSGSTSTGGTRKTFSESLEDLINDGRLKANQKIVGAGGVEGKILKAGKVKIGDQEFGNLSAAASWVKQEGDTSKKVSLNGWDFFTVTAEDGNAVTIGSLRRS
jgi:hypothetical protein